MVEAARTWFDPIVRGGRHVEVTCSTDSKPAMRRALNLPPRRNVVHTHKCSAPSQVPHRLCVETLLECVDCKAERRKHSNHFDLCSVDVSTSGERIAVQVRQSCEIVVENARVACNSWNPEQGE